VIDEVHEAFGISERRVYLAVEHPRSNQRYIMQIPNQDQQFTKRIVDLAMGIEHYGYRRITTLFQTKGWFVNFKQV